MTSCVILLLSTKVKNSELMCGLRHYAHYDMLPPKQRLNVTILANATQWKLQRTKAPKEVVSHETRCRREGSHTWMTALGNASQDANCNKPQPEVDVIMRNNSWHHSGRVGRSIRECCSAIDRVKGRIESGKGWSGDREKEEECELVASESNTNKSVFGTMKTCKGHCASDLYEEI